MRYRKGYRMGERDRDRARESGGETAVDRNPNEP